jgi:hypothetical protein
MLLSFTAAAAGLLAGHGVAGHVRKVVDFERLIVEKIPSCRGGAIFLL